MQQNILSIFRQRSLTKDFLLFGALVIIMMLGLFLWFSWRSYNDLSTNISQSLEAQSSRVERSMSDTFEYTAYLMNHLNHQIRDHGASDLNYISNLLVSYRYDPVVNNTIPWHMFSWVNSDLKLVANSDVGIAPTPYDMHDREYFVHTIDHPDTIFIGEPTYGKVSNKWVIPVGMGVDDKNGHYLGGMIFGLNIAHLTTKFENILPDNGLYFAFVDKNGHVIIESHHQYISMNTHLIDKLKNIDLTDNPKGMLSSFSFSHDNDGFSYYQTMPKYGYTLIMAYDKKSSMQNILESMSQHFIELCVIAFFICTLLYIMKKSIISPIMQLSLVADQAVKGSENLTFPKSDRYEIRNLAMHLGNVIDYMSKLRGTQKSLEKSVRDLEEAKDKAEAARTTAEIAREEARRAFLSKGQFLSRVAHEIQVPVNTVLDYADKQAKLLSPKMMNNDYAHYGKKIAESTYFIKLLVDDLLETAKSENDTIHLEERPLAIEQIIDYSVDMLHTRSSKYNIAISIEIEPNMPRLCADDLRMKQIINNILSNAIKYTSHGGTVRIKASTNNQDQIMIEVIDSGLGIMPDEIDKISEDFYRINKHKDKIDGNGLGLPLAKRLMELHGGTLHIESKVNVGTHVTLTFPSQRTMHQKLLLSQAVQ